MADNEWLFGELDRQGRRPSWLADQLGVNKSNVSHWKAGLPVPQRHIPRIKELLGLEVEA